MEIPLLKGRLFTDHDTRSQPRVVVIDDFMAQQLWPTEEPLGKRIRSGGIDAAADTPWLTGRRRGRPGQTRSTATRGSRCTCRTRRPSAAASMWCCEAMRNLLYGVDAADPATFTTVALILTAIALAASYFPARRAARIDPRVSLRSE